MNMAPRQLTGGGCSSVTMPERPGGTSRFQSVDLNVPKGLCRDLFPSWWHLWQVGDPQEVGPTVGGRPWGVPLKEILGQ